MIRRLVDGSSKGNPIWHGRKAQSLIQKPQLSVQMREDRAVALPRFRLRTLLVALAVLALLIDAGIESERLLRQASYYRYWARMHGLTETTMRRMLAQTEVEIARCEDPVAVRAVRTCWVSC